MGDTDPITTQTAEEGKEYDLAADLMEGSETDNGNTEQQTAEAETDSRDTNGDQQTQDGELKSQTKPEEKPAAAEEGTALTYKGQTQTYTREQLIELAQKGLDYDGLRADRDRLRDNHPALAILDRYAKQSGMTRDQYLDFCNKQADESEIAPVVAELKAKGTPETVARELALRRLQATRGQEAQKKAEDQARQTADEKAKKEADQKADFLALAKYATANKIDLKELPQEVIRAIADGQKPMDAYRDYEIRQLRMENEQLKTNGKNKTKNPGPANDNTPGKTEDALDAALRAWEG